MKKQILITWDAYNNGFVVTAKVLLALLEKYQIQIDTLYYLQNQDLSDNNLAEIDLFFNKKKYRQILEKSSGFEGFSKLRERLSEDKTIKEKIELETKLPKFKQQRFHLKSVTDYQSIYDNLRKFIEEFYNKDIEIHINVSPGTPHMHVVWLMLNTSGILPSNSTLWSSQWNRQNGETTLEKIKFKPKTFLSEVFEKKFLNSTSPKIDPNKTKSSKRKEVEERLILFSKIPKIPILLLGERGTGKSTYVREFINQNKDNYVELVTGTFTDELMRAELFGYKKGSFTGANTDKEGLLDKVKNNGLLFLDEIQDLSKQLQRQLMQVLQTGEYNPIGATETKKSNFRLITASNLDYNTLTQKLDLDFLDRISNFIVEIPPVRDCMEDIELYWEKMWEEIACFDSAPSVIWSPILEKYILKQELKGNFRDLHKLASYTLAFYLNSHNKKEAISMAISEIEKRKQSIETKALFFKKGAEYNEIIAEFNKYLAQWAIKTYGNKKQASRTLKRSESMLNKDLNKDRLK